MDNGWKQNSESVAGFLNFLRDIQTAYSVASQMETDADNQTQDILHRLELNRDSAEDMERMAQALQAIRKTRREAKDSEAKAEPVMRWIKENGRVKAGLESMLGELRKVEKRILNRSYTAKTNVLEELLKSKHTETEPPEHPDSFQEFLKLTKEHGCLPVVAMVDGRIAEDEGYWMGRWGKCCIDKYKALKDGEILLYYDQCASPDIPYLFEQFFDYAECGIHKDMPPARTLEIMKQKIDALDWTEAIFVYIDAPEITEGQRDEEGRV